MTTTTSESLESHERTARLLSQAGFTGPFALVPVQGGANSKAMRVERAPGPSLFLKEYFRHADDPRDRLGTEFAFASFAWEQGIRDLAQPLAMDRTASCALYGFLEGRKLEPLEITPSIVAQALRFFAALNAHKNTAAAARLPNASEACFSLEEHAECLRRRIRRLASIEPESTLDAHALQFSERLLAPAAAACIQSVYDRVGTLGLDPRATLSPIDRCLSPSDFGFHNALVAADGTLRFLDFEYAGWDDPAKTVCDFFCQPACPTPLEFWREFAGAIARDTSDPASAMGRFDLLLPLYRLKWCCIMLNDFLPAGAGRRRFALHGFDALQRKEQQLQKAHAALHQFRCAA